MASSYRSHGIGALWDWADEGANTSIKLETELAAEIGEPEQSIMKRVSEMHEIKDLLEECATGPLYLAEEIAAQSKLPFEDKSE